MRYIRFLFCSMVLLCTGVASAQNYEKIVVNTADSVSGYYLATVPDKIESVLVLLDGFAGSPESIIVESKLPQIAFANNVLTICASMGEKIYADSAVINNMNLILRDVIRRYKVSPAKFVMGGFSAGGTISLRYTELCKQSPAAYPINPAGVFAVDSPVDIIDLWNFFDKQIAKNYSEVAVNEAKFVSAIMQREHGNPKQNLQTYQWLTPFDNANTGTGNEKFLANIPVRMYHDVDIAWQLQNRRRSAYEANYLNSSEMILRLLVLKNESAEFIKGKTGYRANGMRHPHSWNIVDEVECVQWVKKVVAKK